MPAGKVVYYQYDGNVRRSWYPFQRFVIQPSKEGGDAILSGLVVSASRPRLAHAPVRRIDPGRDATLSCTITMPPRPEGDSLSASSQGRLASAALVWRTNRRQGWQTTPMTTDDGFVYAAHLPRGTLSGRWLQYAFEATDMAGQVERLPPLREETFFRARLTADTEAPTVVHQAIKSAVPGQDLTVRARVSDPSGVAVVRVYYRPLWDLAPYECVELHREGDEYVGTIPGEAIRSDFEFIYYLEAVDQAGNGRFYPDWKKDPAPYVIVPVQR